MSKTIDSDQSPRRYQTDLNPVNLLKLVTYSDNAGEVVDTTFWFSTRTVLYDYGNSGTTRRFSPFIAGLGTLDRSMPHLPNADSVDALLTTWTFTLLNAPFAGSRLATHLRNGHTLENATVEWSQILLASRSNDSILDLSSYDGDEHTVFFRGRIRSVGPINSQTIAFTCTSQLPSVEFLRRYDATATIPEFVGVPVAKVYGSARRVPCVPWTVGASTTLAEFALTSATTLVLTDASGVDTTGTAYLGSEIVSWTGKSSNTLTGVTRGEQGTTDEGHPIGTSFSELLSTSVWLAADHEVSSIGDVYAYTPALDQLVRLTTDFTKTAADAATVSGQTVASLSFTRAQLEEAIVAASALGSPPITDTSEVTSLIQYPLSDATYHNGTADDDFIGIMCGNKDLTEKAGYSVSVTDAGTELIYCKFARPTAGYDSQTIRALVEVVSGNPTIKLYASEGIGGTLIATWTPTATEPTEYESTTVLDTAWVTFQISDTNSSGTSEVKFYHVECESTCTLYAEEQDAAACDVYDDVTTLFGWVGPTDTYAQDIFDADTSTGRDVRTIAWPEPSGGYLFQRIEIVVAGFTYGNGFVFQLGTKDASYTDVHSSTYHTGDPDLGDLTNVKARFKFDISANKGYLELDLASGGVFYEVKRTLYREAETPSLAIPPVSEDCYRDNGTTDNAHFCNFLGANPSKYVINPYDMDVASGTPERIFLKFPAAPADGYGARKLVVIGDPANSTAGSMLVYSGRVGTDEVLLDTHVKDDSYDLVAWETDVGSGVTAEWFTLEFTNTSGGGTASWDLFCAYMLIDPTIYGSLEQEAEEAKLEGYTETSSSNWTDDDSSTSQTITATDTWCGAKFEDPGEGYDFQVIQIEMAPVSDGSGNCFVEVGNSWFDSSFYRIHPDDDASTQHNATTEYPLDDEARAIYRFTTEEQANYVRVRYSNQIKVYEIKRTLYRDGTYTTDSEVVASGDASAAGLLLYADIEGALSPTTSPDYKCGDDALITAPADALRHWIEVVGGESIGSTQYDTAHTNLGTNAVSCDVRSIGETWEGVLLALAADHRISVVPAERSTGTEWHMFAAESDYGFPASIRTISAFGEVEEIGDSVGDVGSIATRFTAAYDKDPSIQDEAQSFTLALSATADDNDLTTPSTADLEAAEEDFGVVVHAPIVYRAVRATATAKEVFGYTVNEKIRRTPSFAVSGVPWWLAYDLELGDIVSLTPPWETSARKLRIIHVSKDPQTEMVSLTGVEVE